MPITRFKDEKEKEEYLKQIRQQQQANLQEANRRNQEATTKFNELANNSNNNSSTNSNSLWDQIKTTANNNFNNTNSLTFGFDDTIQGNKQASNFLKGLAKDSGYGRNNGFKTSSRASDYMKQALEANKRSQDLQAQEEAKEKDKDSSILSKVGDFFKNLLSGVTQGSANLAQGYTDTMAMLEKNLSKNKTSRLDNQIEASPYINDELNYENKVNANRENTVDKLIGNVGNTIGNMIPSIVVGQATGSAFSDVGGKIGTAISKNASNMAMATQVLGNETANTQLDGQDFNKSYVTGLAKSAVSFATEKLTGGDILSKGTSLDDMAKKYVVNKFKSDWGKRLATAGLNIAGEVTEENLENQLNYVVDKVINNKDMPDLKNWWNDASETTKTTFFTTALMQLVGLGGSSYKDYVDTDNMNKNDTKNYQKAFDEVKKVINNTSNTKDTTNNNVNTNLNTNTNTQQDIANRLNEIVKNDKYLSKEDKEAMIYATNDLASKNQLDNNNTLEAINQIKQMSQLSQEQNEQLDIGKKYLSGRKEIYNKYRSVTNYDNSIVQQAKDVVPSNKQGKRTKEQWLDVAKYIGTNIADKSNSEIQEIAYKSWQEETPNNSATLNKQGQKYVKFMSDEWIDTIYDAVEKQRQKSGYLANNDTVNALDNFYKEYTNNQTAQNLKDKNIENINNNLYNINKDRGDINEQVQREGMAGVPKQYGTGIQQKEKQQNNKSYTRKEYEEFEKSVKQIESNKLTEGQRKLIDNYKGQYNKNIVFFDGQQNNNGYLGGASLNDKNKIYVDVNSAKTFGENKIINHELMESDILHNRKISNDIIQPAIQKIIDDPEFQNQKLAFWENQEGEIPSDYAIAKDILCDRFTEIRTGEKLDYNNVLSQETNMNIDFALEKFYKSLYGKDLKENSINKEAKPSIEQPGAWQSFLENQIGSSGKGKTVQELRLPTKENWEIIRNSNKSLQNKRKLNPVEISKLRPEDASTTPTLKSKKYEKGNKQSSFFSNIITDSEFLNKDLRQEIGNEESVKYYKGITNKETLEKSYKDLQDGGTKEVLNWFSKDDKNITADDVTKGWILLKQYQDIGDYASAVEVAKKMRDMGTKAGQTVQAFNILSRLTPEGMTLYAQKELSEAYNQMVKGKSKKWIEENESKFDLSPNETAFIKDTMEQVSKMEDGYDKKVKLAEIQKLITDKIPPAKGQGIKAWMRISMLFNPKTQVRNVAGNAVILPVNMFSDSVSAGVDRLISKKTGVRTTGNINIKNYVKGFGKGLSESYNDFKKGINTRNIEENRFEVGEGKSFKDKGVGKALNRVDGLLSFMLDAGDRGFYEATFNNSINNQKVLNGTNDITQDMIDIATTEALQRTWQDSNTYTNSVLGIRNLLNKVNANGYGLGDVLIPFAKTPANLTKAIIDYSPIGLTKTLTLDAKRFKNAIDTGQYVPQMQHKFVQDIGKGFAGTFLYVAGYALAKAGILSGEADDDKDVKNFMKNSLGISSYSIKIGNKSFTYDWAQPVATPFAIMTNFVKYDKENPEANILEKSIKALNIGTEQLLEQSFMESLNTVLNGNGEILENLTQAVLELPARAIPTFSKQIADMVDSTQRTTFEYDKPIQSAINSVIAKIPIASKKLAPSIDTLGNEIQKYGGENNFFNVFINPANTNKGQITKAGTEIYNLYMKTGESKVFPATAPYYINSNGDKIVMDSKQRANYQKIAGHYTEKAIDELISNKDYKKLNDEQKVELISDIISDSNNMAKYKVLNIESKDAKKTREFIEKVGTKAYYDYTFKTKDIEGEDANKQKMNILEKANYSNNIKAEIYSNTIGQKDDNYNTIYKNAGININEYLKYKQQDFTSNKKDDGTIKGKSISGSKKNKLFKYVNSMYSSYENRLLLLGTQYKLSSSERNTLFKYVNSLNVNYEDKLKFLGKCKGFTVYKNGTVKY